MSKCCQMFLILLNLPFLHCALLNSDLQVKVLVWYGWCGTPLSMLSSVGTLVEAEFVYAGYCSMTFPQLSSGGEEMMNMGDRVSLCSPDVCTRH